MSKPASRAKRQHRRPKRFLYSDEDEPEPTPVPEPLDAANDHNAALRSIASELRQQTRLWKRAVRAAEEVEAAVTEMSETLKDVRDLLDDSSSSSEAAANAAAAASQTGLGE